MAVLIWNERILASCYETRHHSEPLAWWGDVLDEYILVSDQYHTIISSGLIECLYAITYSKTSRVMRNENWSSPILLCRRSAVMVKDVQYVGLQLVRVRIVLASHAPVLEHSACIYARAPNRGCHGVNHVAPTWAHPARVPPPP